ncbi:MAG: ATP-binding cassette domain-containing protein [Peptococcaceae bacterium]|nr:ATP-binding cassette domain-containing protein [Peptococcaceae bacterium]
MLELKHISFTAKEDGKESSILKDIDLRLESGRFYVITGPNGGGKSTLAKIIMGIERQTAGEIWFDGQNISEMSISDRAKLGIGYAFQQPPRFKGIKVRKLLSLSADDKTKMRTCSNSLIDVGLCTQDYINRDVDASLSGGELKRIEIATLLNRTLKLALFDEPEAGIDLWSFAKLTETFSKMHQESKGTIVIISHQERILKLADEIIMISDGRIVKQGSRDEVLPGILKEGPDCACEFKKGGREAYECTR